MMEAFGRDVMTSQYVTSKDVTKYMKVRHCYLLGFFTTSRGT